MIRLKPRIKGTVPVVLIFVPRYGLCHLRNRGAPRRPKTSWVIFAAEALSVLLLKLWQTVQFIKTYGGIQVDTDPTAFSPFCRDDHSTICSPYPVKGSRCSTFKYGHGFDIRRIDICRPIGKTTRCIVIARFNGRVIYWHPIDHE